MHSFLGRLSYKILLYFSITFRRSQRKKNHYVYMNFLIFLRNINIFVLVISAFNSLQFSYFQSDYLLLFIIVLNHDGLCSLCVSPWHEFIMTDKLMRPTYSVTPRTGFSLLAILYLISILKSDFVCLLMRDSRTDQGFRLNFSSIGFSPC